MTPYWLSFSLPVLYAVFAALGRRAGRLGQPRLAIGLTAVSCSCLALGSVILLARSDIAGSPMWYAAAVVTGLLGGWAAWDLRQAWREHPKRQGWTEDAL